MKIFDAHGDILPLIYYNEKRFLEEQLPMYLQSNVNATIMVNFYDPKKPEEFKLVDTARNVLETNEYINIIDHNNYVEDRVNVILGIEGLSAINTIEEIEELIKTGYRHFGITWNEQNSFASSHEFDEGLTTLGKELVEMLIANKCVIDFAHANEKCINDYLDISNKPIFISHTGVKGVYDISRNISDGVLQSVKQTNGVVGIYNIGMFLTKDEPTIENFLAHIDYVVQTIGIDHVGFGFDFCYYLDPNQDGCGVENLNTMAEVPNVIKRLSEKGYSNEEIEKIAYKNMMRVISELMN